MHPREQFVADTFVRSYFAHYLADRAQELRTTSELTSMLRRLGQSLAADPNKLTVQDFRRLSRAELLSTQTQLRQIREQFKRRVYGPAMSMDEVTFREVVFEKLQALSESVEDATK